MYYSLKANQAMEKTLPLDNANLATHLLRMCPLKWPTQYNLMENTTPISTSAILPVFENIESNAKLYQKPPNSIKANRAGGKCKIKSINSCIPKELKKVG